MGLQQVVEELHIELVVFDDQNFFGHFCATRATAIAA
jgi:hypothetical protein